MDSQSVTHVLMECGILCIDIISFRFIIAIVLEWYAGGGVCLVCWDVCLFYIINYYNWRIRGFIHAIHGKYRITGGWNGGSAFFSTFC